MKTNSFLKISFLSFAAVLIFSSALFAAQNGTEPKEGLGLEIEGPQPELQQKPIEKIEEIGVKIPEVPKSITRPRLSPAEEEELAKEEAKRAAGTVTETEYQIKKDTLGRDSNIKF